MKYGTPRQDGAPEISEAAFAAVSRSIFNDREFKQDGPLHGFWWHAVRAAGAEAEPDRRDHRRFLRPGRKETVRRYLGVYPGELVVLCSPKWPLDWYTGTGTVHTRAEAEDLERRATTERYCEPRSGEAASILRWLGRQERLPGVPQEYLPCTTSQELMAAEKRRMGRLAAVTPRPTWIDMIRRLAQSDRRYANYDRSWILNGDARRREYKRWFEAEPVRNVPFLTWASALSRLARADAKEPGPPNDGRIADKLHRECYLRAYMRGVAA